MMKQYFGKYRGTVMNNVDPMKLGRIQVSVADLAGLIPSTWAMPCLPIAGKQSGVWVEFETGDINKPIWTGCYWGIAAEVPVMALAGNPASPSIVFQTAAQNTIVMADGPSPPLVAGGVLIKSGASMISVGPDGVKIVAPKIEIDGMVIVNKGNLTVLI
jgi:Type VI secretion system/phage-baseplate injector OB domain